MLDATDYFLINRDGNIQKVQSSNLMAIIEDSDYLLINRSGQTYKISGEDVRLSLNTGSPLAPAVPPFGGLATTETVLNSADGKIEFSLNGTSYSTNLTVPVNTFYYVDWGSDVLTVNQGDSYAAQITATYNDLGTSSTIDFNISSADKLPDPFSFTSTTDHASNAQFTSNIVSPLETINVPTQIWVTSDASAFEIRVGDGTWFNPPAVPGSAYVSHNQEIQVRHTTGLDSDYPYTTTVYIGYGTNAGEFESGDFVTRTRDASIDQPSITSPSEGADANQNALTFTSSTATGVAFGTHFSTDWQISLQSDFSSIYEESLGDTTNLTSYTASTQTDVDNQTFYVRCRYNSDTGVISPYSATRSVVGKRYYTWRIVVSTRGEDGGTGGFNSGGKGRQVITTMETTAPFLLPPGSLSQTNTFASGGTASGGQAGPGGDSAASTLNGTRINVAGGGGGAAGEGSSSGGSAGWGGAGTGNPNPNNGPSTSRYGCGAGGAGGDPGSTDEGGNNRPGGGGGSYAIGNNDTIGNWRAIGSTSNANGGAAATSVVLERQYKSGSFSQVNSATTFNGSLSSLA